MEAGNSTDIAPLSRADLPPSHQRAAGNLPPISPYQSSNIASSENRLREVEGFANPSYAVNRHPTATKFPRTVYYLVLLALGLTAFGLCLLSALRWLPEWNAAEIPPAAQLQQRVRELATAHGIELGKALPRLSLATKPEERSMVYQFMAGEASGWLQGEKRPFFVHAQTKATWRGGPPTTLIFALGLDSRLWIAKWIPPSIEAILPTVTSREEQARQAPDLLSLFLQPDETMGESVQTFFNGTVVTMYVIERQGSATGETILNSTQNAILQANRSPGTLDQGKELRFSQDLELAVLRKGPKIAFFLLVLGLLIRLGLRQRIDFKNAAILTAPILIAFLTRKWFYRFDGWIYILEIFVLSITGPLAFFLLWSVAESWHRTSRPVLLDNLDWLRQGRVGPQAGRAILGGFALGGLLAGLILALPAIATALSWSWGAQSTVPLPAGLLPTDGLLIGSFNAAKVLLLLTLAFRILPNRWAPVAAVVLSALVVDGPLAASWWSLAANLILATVLVVAHERWNVTGLLTTSLVGSILPIATFAAFHFDWMSGTLVTSLAFFGVLLLAGFVGLSQPQDQEYQNAIAPVFVRRIEKQRRLRYEMDLLARMQRGLLPTSLPQVAGYQIAARSLLATEVGGDLYHFHHEPGESLWIAAGDVAGHGYSCAIAQAMTKAGLVSLLDNHSSPAEVLHKLDRVLRAGSIKRHFTSLVLLRLELLTGRAWIANAGHPYPFHVSRREAHEISMPSLPLGQGPARIYSDQELRLHPGDSLVLYSDGLYEATSPSGKPYGFRRPLEALGRQHIATANEMLEGLLADWRYHLSGAAASDDTTLVVLKRADS